MQLALDSLDQSQVSYEQYGLLVDFFNFMDNQRICYKSLKCFVMKLFEKKLIHSFCLKFPS